MHPIELENKSLKQNMSRSGARTRRMAGRCRSPGLAPGGRAPPAALHSAERDSAAWEAAAAVLSKEGIVCLDSAARFCIFSRWFQAASNFLCETSNAVDGFGWVPCSGGCRIQLLEGVCQCAFLEPASKNVPRVVISKNILFPKFFCVVVCLPFPLNSCFWNCSR